MAPSPPAASTRASQRGKSEDRSSSCTNAAPASIDREPDACATCLPACPHRDTRVLSQVVEESRELGVSGACKDAAKLGATRGMIRPGEPRPIRRHRVRLSPSVSAVWRWPIFEPFLAHDSHGVARGLRSIRTGETARRAVEARDSIVMQPLDQTRS